jgi:hypothetical protein
VTLLVRMALGEEARVQIQPLEVLSKHRKANVRSA